MIKLDSNEIKKLGVIIADEQEFAPFVGHFSSYENKGFSAGGFRAVSFDLDGTEIIAMHCGIGKVNAAAAAATLIHLCGVRMLLNVGLSGGVQVKRNAVIVSTRFVEHDFDLTPLGRPIGLKPGEELFSFPDAALLEAARRVLSDAFFGTLGSGDGFIADEKKVKYFIDEFDEYACDMESAAIASVAKRNNVPFLAIRKISDSADENATDDYNDLNDKEEADLAIITEKLIKYISE